MTIEPKSDENEFVEFCTNHKKPIDNKFLWECIIQHDVTEEYIKNLFILFVNYWTDRIKKNKIRRKNQPTFEPRRRFQRFILNGKVWEQTGKKSASHCEYIKSSGSIRIE